MKKKTTSPEAISGLKFLGPISEKIMVEAGIKNVTQLRRLGSVAAFLKAKQVDPRVSLNLLWALEGALSSKHWREVAREDRTSLLFAVEAMQGQYRSPAPKPRRTKLKTGN